MKISRLIQCTGILMLLGAFNLQLSPLLAQGTAFNYQGKLIDGTNLASGYYDMEFYLRDAYPGGNPVGTTNIWGGVIVSNGLFTVPLDFGAGIFTGPARWLEIGVRTNGSAAPYTILAPRQLLRPTPYAIMAGGVSSGSITTTQIASGQVVKSLNGLTDALTLSSGANVTLATNGNNLTISSTGGGGVFSLNSTNAYYTAGNLGLGTSSPAARLNVVGAGALGTTFQEKIQAGSQTLALGANTTAAEIQSIGSVPLYLNHGGNNVVLIDTAPPGLNPPTAGYNVGIGTPNPTATLDIRPPIYSFPTNQSGGIQLATKDDNWFSGMFLRVDSQGNPRLAFDAISRELLSLLGDGSIVTPGFIGIGGFNTVTHPTVELDIAAPQGRARLRSSNNSSDGSILYFRNDTTGLNVTLGTIAFQDANNAINSKITAGVDGSLALWAGGPNSLGPKLTVFPSGTVSVPVLQINGADVAEPFKLSVQGVPKGSVMVIDETHSGQLKLSANAYDKTVAGILSGANGVHPGIRLKQEGFNDDGEEVALSGRVYALADASYGPIKPGDLLTTSDTPGHCMKATDYSRAQGAIIGKAMSSLTEGKGMVLVLVTLQ